MYFAIDTPNFGDYSDPRLLAELARVAENAGRFEGDQQAEQLSAYAEVGVTWWLDCSCWNQSLAEMREYIHQGPPHY
jgi:hypothetical protein